MIRRFVRGGEPFIWLTGSALAAALAMIVLLVGLIVVNGLGFFWPGDLVQLSLVDGSSALGQVRTEEDIPQPGAPPGTPLLRRLQLQVGNRDSGGQDFRWIDVAALKSRERPAQALLLERREWGPYFGFLQEVRVDGKAIATGPTDEAFRALQEQAAGAARSWTRLHAIERDEIGAINLAQERNRLAIRREQLAGSGPERIRPLEEESVRLKERFRELDAERGRVSAEMGRATLVLRAADGAEKEIPAWTVVRALRPNLLGWTGRLGVYLSRLWEFVSGEPRESNTEGGVFPAIFGTVMMVFLMTLAVVPLGVVAALYLREYARQGPLVRVVRIAVNNLAGVPSIVFGVFGLGFFVYFVGGSIDRIFYPEALPTPTYGTGGILWASLTLALLTVPVVIVATEEGLAAVPRDIRHGSLALGATKFETIWRVVLPNAMPGILTGVILAMARAAGEVAPLMITGVVKLAPTLPVDGTAPFVHLDRKFMHLGFHIYDVGFQSPNVEAARPMVYATTFLLLVIVVALNLLAIGVRNRLRARNRTSAV